MRSTVDTFKPIFISVGHRVSLPTAVKIAKMTCKFRVPEPIRQVASCTSREFEKYFVVIFTDPSTINWTIYYNQK